MAGMLYVVATPIGNLEDITLRAIRILKEVDGIAAEDTRHTAQLLRHLHIHKPLLSLHEHNENERAQLLADKLEQGETWAFVSDAGTPGICDPGARLVQTLHKKQIRCIPVPGPSALATAISVAGLSSSHFHFEGFLPVKGAERKERLQKLFCMNEPFLLYEAPHRLQKTLHELYATFGDAPLVVARELTKVYEQICTTTIGQAKEQFAAPKGEFVLVIEPLPQTRTVDKEQAGAYLNMLMEQGLSHRQAAAQTADLFGMRKNEAYALALKEDE